MDRRAVLRLGAAGAVVALAGCASDDGDGEETDTGSTGGDDDSTIPDETEPNESTDDEEPTDAGSAGADEETDREREGESAFETTEGSDVEDGQPAVDLVFVNEAGLTHSLTVLIFRDSDVVYERTHEVAAGETEETRVGFEESGDYEIRATVDKETELQRFDFEAAGDSGPVTITITDDERLEMEQAEPPTEDGGD
ncbi:hypothetical protein ACNS7O_05715 [Haloferacaceae archaeon DSL9]